jgi:hypothetical protein
MTPPIRPAGGGGDAVDLGKAAPGVAHGGRDDHIERLHMGARRDLRHHAAERRMLLDLRQHHIGKDGAAAILAPFDQRRRGLVAGRLDAEHDHVTLHVALHVAVLLTAVVRYCRRAVC